MSHFRPLTHLLPRTQTRTLARMTLIGRLAAPPEVSISSNGRHIVKYALGVATGTRDNPDTSWFRVTNFPISDNQRDFMAGLPKGQQLWVEADGKMQSFESAQGEKRSTFNLVQRSFELLAKPLAQVEEGSHTDDRAAAAASHGAEAGDEAVSAAMR